MPIETSDLEEMLARVKEREAKAEAELQQAETKAERDEIRDRLEALEARNAELEKLLSEAEPEEEPEKEPEPEEEPEPSARRTRPGRKSGSAYTYTINEDGNRVEVDIPTIYSGPDEPDEVELPDVSDAA